MQRGIDYIGVGVGAVIVDDQGRLFLARRGPQAKNERGLWEFPGGSVEFGECLTDALKREMREEYGVEITVGELLDVVDHLLPTEGQHWVSPRVHLPHYLRCDHHPRTGEMHRHRLVCAGYDPGRQLDADLP